MLARHLQRAAPCRAFSTSLVLSAAALCASPSSGERSAALRVLLEAAEVGVPFSCAEHLWTALARGCTSSNSAIRVHCYQAACALHETLTSVWHAALVGQCHDKNPQQLLLAALQMEAANRGGTSEIKAAAFICTAAFHPSREASREAHLRTKDVTPRARLLRCTADCGQALCRARQCPIVSPKAA